MPGLFEPTPRFTRGDHKALEVDADRLQQCIEALNAARQLGDAAPIVALIDAHAGVRLLADQFFVSDDGYPPAGNLEHYIPKIVRAEGATVFGLGVLGEIYATDICIGDALVDLDAPESPDWLDARIDLPFRFTSAETLFNEIDWRAGIDDDAISTASEAYDMGEMGDELSGTGVVDALDDWAARLRDALEDFKLDLEDIAARDGHVISWYERL